jgi:tetratricopeptide (TPR) repeat protein
MLYWISLVSKERIWRMGKCLAFVLICLFIVLSLGACTKSEAQTHFEQGVAYHKQSELNLAMEEYSKAIEIDPGLGEAYNNRGKIHSVRGDYELAIADIEEAQALRPQDAKPYLNGGFVRAESGDLEGALNDLTKAIERDPNLASAFFLRGRIYAVLKEPEKAISDLERAVELGMEADETWLAEEIIEELKQ